MLVSFECVHEAAMMDVLPVSAHMIPLGIAAAESNQTGVAGVGKRCHRRIWID